MKYVLIDWYDENEMGEVVQAGSLYYKGNLPQVKAKWDELAIEHDFCVFEYITKERFDEFVRNM